MNKKSLIIVTLMLACFIGGYFAGGRVESRRAQDALAMQTYGTFEAVGFCGGLSCQRAFWRQQLGDELARALAQPYIAITPDDTWGTAYLTMRDSDDPRTYCHSSGMSPSQQDQMIRYLCFRIEKIAESPGYDGAQGEFAALTTYPQETIGRNRDRIQRAVLEAAGARYDQTRILAARYVVHLTDCDWGKELCWTRLCTARHPSTLDAFSSMMHDLYSIARGDYYGGMGDPRQPASKPTAEAQSGASAVLARFVQANWPDEDGLGRGTNYQIWRDKLKKSALPAATQPAH